MARATRYEVRQAVARHLKEEQFDSRLSARLKDVGGAVVVVALWSGTIFLIASAALYWTDSALALAAGVLLGIFLPYGMVHLSNTREKRLRDDYKRLRNAYEDVCVAQSGEMDRLRRKLDTMQRVTGASHDRKERQVGAPTDDGMSSPARRPVKSW